MLPSRFVVYEDNHVIVINKPINMPVQKDSSGHMDVQTATKMYLKWKHDKPGNVFLGLVHRLDRPVGGLMVFGKTSKGASRLSDQIRKHEVNKVYWAVVRGKVLPKAKLTDYLWKNTAENFVNVVPSNHAEGKKAVLSYSRQGFANNHSLVEIELETGRPHQIRVQLSSRKHAIWADRKYGTHTGKRTDSIALFSKKLSFRHPTTKEELHFEAELPNKAPWEWFGK